MKAVHLTLCVLLAGCVLPAARGAEPPAKQSPKEALRIFNDLVGSWRGTGIPEGTQQEKQRGFWIESISWQWQFKNGDVALRAVIDKGKYYTGAELRYLPDKDLYQLTVQTTDKDTLTFTGKLEDKRLTLDRSDDKKKANERLVVSLLHANRYLYRYETGPLERPVLKKVYQVGVTKEGVPFAEGDAKPECVVSGGLGTMTVMYKGKTYYVCCSGCRDAFKDDPEKYIKEYEERKAQEAKEKKK
jgi:ribosomal protein L24E